MAAIRATGYGDAKVNEQSNETNTHKEKNLEHNHLYANPRKERGPQLPNIRKVGCSGPRNVRRHPRPRKGTCDGPRAGRSPAGRSTEDKPNPDKVRELTSRTLDVWQEVKILNANGDPAEEPSAEQIDLEVLSLTMGADEPERLAITAASAVAAAGTLFSIHAQGLLDSHPDATG